MDTFAYTEQIKQNGFTIVEQVFSSEETEQLVKMIDAADTQSPLFRKSENLFAIRQFLKEVPGVIPDLFNTKFRKLINEIFGPGYFIVKSIYFDKPEASNWFVSWHQDLTISVDKKTELENFGPWTVKQDQFAVQPPIEILEQIFTVRIHLDDTDENNGALKVIPGSHLKKIIRPETINLSEQKETICKVPKGGIMIMKSLLLHSSGRTINHKKRRVIHIEFANCELPAVINWAERMSFNK